MGIFQNKKIIAIFCIILALLLIPFDVDRLGYSGAEITLYKAALYTVVRAEVFGLIRSEVCFFPSNLDLNNNFSVVSDLLGGISNTFNNYFISELP